MARGKQAGGGRGKGMPATQWTARAALLLSMEEDDRGVLGWARWANACGRQVRSLFFLFILSANLFCSLIKIARAFIKIPKYFYKL